MRHRRCGELISGFYALERKPTPSCNRWNPAVLWNRSDRQGAPIRSTYGTTFQARSCVDEEMMGRRYEFRQHARPAFTNSRGRFTHEKVPCRVHRWLAKLTTHPHLIISHLHLPCLQKHLEHPSSIPSVAFLTADLVDSSPSSHSAFSYTTTSCLGEARIEFILRTASLEVLT